MLGQYEDVMRTEGLEEEKLDIKLDSKITTAIFEELIMEFQQSANHPLSNYNFHYLYLLVRALTNAGILEKDQNKFMAKVKLTKMIKKIMNLLNQADTEILKDPKQCQSFCLFVTHVFRFFILCLSID